MAIKWSLISDSKELEFAKQALHFIVPIGYDKIIVNRELVCYQSQNKIELKLTGDRFNITEVFYFKSQNYDGKCLLTFQIINYKSVYLIVYFPKTLTWSTALLSTDFIQNFMEQRSGIGREEFCLKVKKSHST